MLSDGMCMAASSAAPDQVPPAGPLAPRIRGGGMWLLLSHVQEPSTKLCMNPKDTDMDAEDTDVVHHVSGWIATEDKLKQLQLLCDSNEFNKLAW